MYLLTGRHTECGVKPLRRPSGPAGPFPNEEAGQFSNPCRLPPEGQIGQTVGTKDQPKVVPGMLLMQRAEGIDRVTASRTLYFQFIDAEGSVSSHGQREHFNPMPEGSNRLVLLMRRAQRG